MVPTLDTEAIWSGIIVTIVVTTLSEIFSLVKPYLAKALLCVQRIYQRTNYKQCTVVAFAIIAMITYHLPPIHYETPKSFHMIFTPALVQ